jgi:hypothetical protein
MTDPKRFGNSSRSKLRGTEPEVIEIAKRIAAEWAIRRLENTIPADARQQRYGLIADANMAGIGNSTALPF